MRSQGELRVASPFPAEYWPMVWYWIEGFRNRAVDDGSPQSCDGFVEWLLALEKSPQFRSWGVWRGGELGGLVTFERPRPIDIAGWSRAFFKPSFFGRRGRIGRTEEAPQGDLDQPDRLDARPAAHLDQPVAAITGGLEQPRSDAERDAAAILGAQSDHENG
jgi:hypothetical protein